MKIALTIALSHDVKLLILDEATAGMIFLEEKK